MRCRESWARRPTMRQNGNLMRDVTITFAIDREGAAIIAAYRSYRGELTSRKQLMEWIEDSLREHGSPDYGLIEGRYDREEAMAKAFEAVDRLMPELIQEKKK